MADTTRQLGDNRAAGPDLAAARDAPRVGGSGVSSVAGPPYSHFIDAKTAFSTEHGFEVADDCIHPKLKAHQRAIVRWAVQGGRRAIFAAFGLGKTPIQLETVRLVTGHVGGLCLIVLPLGVRQEFARDAAMLGIETRFIRRAGEIDRRPGVVHLTNYETIRDGKLDPALFEVISLDEASVLRSYGSKTSTTFLEVCSTVPHRFVATATPSPNRHKELLHYAGFLGVMDVGQALTRWFKRDSTGAGNLQLFPHKEQEFWLWVSSWAVFLQTPSDLGFSDDGYVLPDIQVVYHEVPVDHTDGAPVDRDGQARLYRGADLGVVQAAREKRSTVDARVAKAAEIVNGAPDDHFVLWHSLEDERRAIEQLFPAVEHDHWCEFRDGHPRALELYERHYSACQYADGRQRRLFMGPGEKTVLLTRDGSALFGWRKFRDDSGQRGVCCAVFRNEGPTLSSDFIREAMAIAWKRWPGERLYTYVNPDKVASPNPGYCFKKAGWRTASRTKDDLIILEALPDAEVPELREQVGLQSVYGSLDLETREQRIIDFSEGRSRLLATKPEISGSGCNFQRHCHRAVFVGIGFDFNDFIQAVHRIQRFQQTEPVRIDVIYAESERQVLHTLQAKWAKHKELTTTMSDLIREHGLSRAAIEKSLTRSSGVERTEVSGEGWLVANNDCVPETESMDTDSVDLIVTSIPFANHYEYTPSYNDFGHTDDNEHFWAQMDYLTPNLLRVLRPGRVYACHVKDRIVFGNMTGAGYSTVSPFHAEAITHTRRHGFEYLGMITVVTDVVRENNQSYRLGWSENAKDSTKMGVGSPEYVLLFRKPQSDRTRGYADTPVVKDKTTYSRARWQTDAHAFWRSSGNRHLTPDELAALPADQLYRLAEHASLNEIYDYETHVRIGEILEARGSLPSTFMLLAPASTHPDVWHDINRMATLNTEQSRRAQEMHVCPLQFDIVDRLICRYSNAGELVYDPFGGLFTVPVRALHLGRRGRAVELNPGYCADGVRYLRAAERKISTPSLFDVDVFPDQPAAPGRHGGTANRSAGQTAAHPGAGSGDGPAPGAAQVHAGREGS